MSAKSLGILSVALSTASLQAATVQAPSCQVTFSQESDAVDAGLLDSCVQTLQIRTGSKLSVLGYASKDGPTRLNFVLSTKRAQNVAQALKARFETLDIKAEGLGVLDQKSRYVVITKLESPEAPIAEVKTEIPGIKVASLDAAVPAVVNEKSASTLSNKSWRAAVRIGADNTRIESEEQYLATGLDLAYIPQVNPYLRLELGVVGSLYSQNNENELTSYHFAPMIGYQNQMLVAGVRGLAGVVQSNASDKDYDDAGAELRVGLEGDQWSFYVGGGRTKNLERVGFDLGMKF